MDPSALVLANLRVSGVEAPEMVPDLGPLAVEVKDLGWVGRVMKRPTQYIWREGQRGGWYRRFGPLGTNLAHPFFSPTSETDFNVVRDHWFDFVDESVGCACEGDSNEGQCPLVLVCPQLT